MNYADCSNTNENMYNDRDWLLKGPGYPNWSTIWAKTAATSELITQREVHEIMLLAEHNYNCSYKCLNSYTKIWFNMWASLWQTFHKTIPLKGRKLGYWSSLLQELGLKFWGVGKANSAKFLSNLNFPSWQHIKYLQQRYYTLIYIYFLCALS
jgi:hypothetical protein